MITEHVNRIPVHLDGKTIYDIVLEDSFDALEKEISALGTEKKKICIIADSNAARDLFDTRIMGLLTDMPHTVNRAFFTAYHKSPEEATDWYYQYSKDTNYVRAGRIAKDMRWTYDCDYGTLDITINRSKPEKDPRDIAAAKNQPQTKYPACQLCIENTGFAGTLTHPARQNLRPIPIQVHGEPWAFQYSPYGYYNEHCIVFKKRPNRPSHTGKSCSISWICSPIISLAPTLTCPL